MSKLENNSIPVNIADSILNELPKELFIDPSNKFCYASIVDDYIIRKLYDKLNEGLKDIIVDEDENKELFFEYIGQNFEILSLINNANVINEDGINNVINKFWDELHEVQNMDALANNLFNIRWNIYK